MADERDLSNKIADGLWGTAKDIGTEIGNAASNLGDQASEAASLSAPDLLNSMWSGKNTVAPQQQNFQDTSSLLNAQEPTPFGSDTTMPVASLGSEADINTMILNSNAAAQGAPLTGAQAKTLVDSKGIGSVPVAPMVQGTAASIESATPQAPVAPNPAAVQIDTQGIVDPFAGSNAKAMQGISQAEQAGQLKAVAEHSFYQKKADVEAEAMDKQQKLQEAFDFKYQEKMDDLTQSMKDFKALAGEKIVPGAILARQDTSGALMTGLAVALGGIGGQLQGTNANIGLEMINKAIDRDVAAQQYNLEHKTRIGKANIDDQNSLLSKMREKFGDDKSAVLAAKLSMMSLVEDKMNQDLTKQGGSRDLAVKSQANIARSQIMQRKEQIEMQLKAAQSAAFDKQQMLQGKDRFNLTPEEAMLAWGDKASQYVNGFGPALSPKDKEKFQEQYGDSKNSLDVLKKIVSTDVNKLSPAERASMGTELALLTGKMRLAVLGPGAMTQQEYDRLRETLGDPTKIVAFPGVEKLKLQTTLNRLQSQQDNLVSQYFGTQRLREIKNNSVDSFVVPVSKPK